MQSEGSGEPRCVMHPSSTANSQGGRGRNLTAKPADPLGGADEGVDERALKGGEEAEGVLVLQAIHGQLSEGPGFPIGPASSAEAAPSSARERPVDADGSEDGIDEPDKARLVGSFV